jgi:hypothetical protein
MRGYPARLLSAWFDRLEAAGVLRAETVWLLFIAKRKGYRLVDPGYFENLRAALYAAVTGPGPVDPGLAALAGLVHAGDLANLLYPGRENAAVRARLAELTSQDPVVPGARSGTATPDDPFLHATQAAVHSAVHHSVHAAVSAATATSHHHSSGSSGGGGSSPSHHHH